MSSKNTQKTFGSFHIKSPQKSAKLLGSDPDIDESAYMYLKYMYLIKILCYWYQHQLGSK